MLSVLAYAISSGISCYVLISISNLIHPVYSGNNLLEFRSNPFLTNFAQNGYPLSAFIVYIWAGFDILVPTLLLIAPREKV